MFSDSLKNNALIFAFWFNESDEIFISEAFAKYFNLSSHKLNAYNFLKIMDAAFGSFLIESIEEIGKIPQGSKQITKFDCASKLLLNLSYLEDAKLYIFQTQLSLGSKFQQDILDYLPLYAWKRDRDLHITYCNKKYADALETSPENVIKNNMQLVLENGGNNPLERIALGTGKSQTSMAQIIVNGEIRILEVTEVPQIGKKLPFGYAVDLTSLKHTQKEYDQYKAQMTDTLHQISVPIAMFDEYMNMTFANEACCKMFYLEESFVRNTPNIKEVLEFIHDKRLLMEIENFQKVKIRLEDFFRELISSYHKTLYMANGKTLNVTISPNCNGGLILVFEDVTDRITLEREYNALSAVQKETLDHLYEGIIVFGTDNRIKMTNPSINKIWEKTEGEYFNGIHIKDFFIESSNLFQSQEDLDAWIYQLINFATKREEHISSMLLANGKLIEFAYVPLPDGLNLLRFVDASDKVQLEKALTDKANIVAQIDKLKSTLISSVSYEFKSSINTIAGFSDILLNEYFGNLNERQREYCEGIINSVGRLEKVVEAMMNLANIESGQLKIQYKEVCLNSFIKDCVSLFEVKAKNQGVSINVLDDNKDVYAYIDEKSMQQAFFQIISKDLTFTPSGGEITIKMELCESPEGFIDIVITDTGIGIRTEDLEEMKKILISDHDEKNLNSMFDFGTMLANNIIRLHNGKMFIDSSEGKGTTMRCRIPIRPFLV